MEEEMKKVSNNKMLKMYEIVFEEMKNYDELPTKKMRITINLPERQVYILRKSAERLKMREGELLQWLLDIQLERIREFINMYRFAEKFIPKE